MYPFRSRQKKCATWNNKLIHDSKSLGIDTDLHYTPVDWIRCTLTSRRCRTSRFCQNLAFNLACLNNNFCSWSCACVSHSSIVSLVAGEQWYCQWKRWLKCCGYQYILTSAIGRSLLHQEKHFMIWLSLGSSGKLCERLARDKNMRKWLQITKIYLKAYLRKLGDYVRLILLYKVSAK